VEVLDGEAADERARPAQSCLAVHSHSTSFALHQLQETLHYLLRRTSPIREVQLVVPDPSLLELIRVVSLVVKSHHCTHTQLLKDGHVVLRSEQHVLSQRETTPESSLPES
jgi:hypothetical protein